MGERPGRNRRRLPPIVRPMPTPTMGGDRIAERRVHHDDAALGGGRHVDIVDADAGPADDAQPGPMEGESDAKYANDFIYEKVATQLGKTQGDQGHWQQAVHWFQEAQKVSRTPEALQTLIDEARAKMAAQTNGTAAPRH